MVCSSLACAVNNRRPGMTGTSVPACHADLFGDIADTLTASNSDGSGGRMLCQGADFPDGEGS
eukprot:3357305-Rhodomonas_salina.1